MSRTSSTFGLRAVPDEIVRAVRDAGRFAEENGASEAARRLELCLEELLTNLATHGAGAAPPAVSVALSVEAGSVRVRVEDDGAPFDPLREELPHLSESLEERSIGGLGIHLVRSFATELDYSRGGGRNVVRFNVR